MTRSLLPLLIAFVVLVCIVGCTGGVYVETSEAHHDEFIEEVEVPTMDAASSAPRDSVDDDGTDSATHLSPMIWSGVGNTEDE